MTVTQLITKSQNYFIISKLCICRADLFPVGAIQSLSQFRLYIRRGRLRRGRRVGVEANQGRDDNDDDHIDSDLIKTLGTTYFGLELAR